MPKINFKKIKKILQKEPKLIEISEEKRFVFVGDTHGDLKTTQEIIEKYLKEENVIVFLGDYVDRGSFSKDNLDFLLKVKSENPERVYLLQGNHEGHSILKFFPADFWQSLDKKQYQRYSSLVESFPLVLTTKDIVALHGAPPDVNNLKAINNIELGSDNWQQITWGDFLDRKGEYLGLGVFTGRPQFGKDYFLKVMKRFNKKVLVRSHQYDSPLFLFNDRCVTVFTSSAYQRGKTIAICEPGQEVKTGKDLGILKF